MGWTYLSIPKLQRLHRWSLGMDKLFHPTWACDYLSMLRLKLNHVDKKGPSTFMLYSVCETFHLLVFLSHDWLKILVNKHIILYTLCLFVLSDFSNTEFSEEQWNLFEYKCDSRIYIYEYNLHTNKKIRLQNTYVRICLLMKVPSLAALINVTSAAAGEEHFVKWYMWPKSAQISFGLVVI